MAYNDKGYQFFEEPQQDRLSPNMQNGMSDNGGQKDVAVDFHNVYVYEPTNASFNAEGVSELEKIITSLKERQAAIINLDSLDFANAQRVLDFMAGAVYALDGSATRISSNIFMLSPKGVAVSHPQE